MNRTAIDGVPVLWAEAPPPLTAEMVFGVGAQDETFRTAGVTHLVEHLVMATLPRSALDRNASVDLNTTSFTATGRPESVVDFLHGVCAGLRDLPLHRMAVEAGVLDAEGGLPEHEAVCHALGLRYGLVGPGLAVTKGAGAREISEQHVRDHLRRFVASNAVLVLTGPPPESLRLDLPQGQHQVSRTAQPLPLRTPSVLRLLGDGVSLSALFEVGDRAVLPLVDILIERVTDDVRHGRGLAYDIDGYALPVTESTAMFAIWSDGQRGDAADTATTMWRALSDLAESGPTDDELRHQVAVINERFTDPRAVLPYLGGQARRLLSGLPTMTLEERHDEALSHATREQVTAAAARASNTTVLLVPEDAEVTVPGLPDATDDAAADDAPFGDEVFAKRLLARAPRDLRVRVGDEGVSIQVDGHVLGAPWSRVVGVASGPRGREIVLDDGRTIPVVAAVLKDSDRLLARIDALAGPLLFAHEDVLLD